MAKIEDKGFRVLARTGEAEEIIGADDPAVAAPAVAPTSTPASPPPVAGPATSSLARGIYGILSAASAAASGYHGMKRNRGSIGWGVVWFALGGMFPVITPTVAVAQGFAKVKPLSDAERDALLRG